MEEGGGLGEREKQRKRWKERVMERERETAKNCSRRVMVQGRKESQSKSTSEK